MESRLVAIIPFPEYEKMEDYLISLENAIYNFDDMCDLVMYGLINNRDKLFKFCEMSSRDQIKIAIVYEEIKIAVERALSLLQISLDEYVLYVLRLNPDTGCLILYRNDTTKRKALCNLL